MLLDPLIRLLQDAPKKQKPKGDATYAALVRFNDDLAEVIHDAATALDKQWGALDSVARALEDQAQQMRLHIAMTRSVL